MKNNIISFYNKCYESISLYLSQILSVCVTFRKLIDNLFKDSLWNQFSLIIFLKQ